MKTIQIRTAIPGPKSRALLARREVRNSARATTGHADICGEVRGSLDRRMWTEIGISILLGASAA